MARIWRVADGRSEQQRAKRERVAGLDPRIDRLSRNGETGYRGQPSPRRRAAGDLDKAIAPGVLLRSVTAMWTQTSAAASAKRSTAHDAQGPVVAPPRWSQYEERTTQGDRPRAVRNGVRYTATPAATARHPAACIREPHCGAARRLVYGTTACRRSNCSARGVPDRTATTARGDDNVAGPRLLREGPEGRSTSQPCGRECTNEGRDRRGQQGHSRRRCASLALPACR